MTTPIEQAKKAHHELVSIATPKIQAMNAAVVQLCKGIDEPKFTASATLLNAVAKLQTDLVFEIPTLIAELDFILRQEGAIEQGDSHE